MTSPTSKTSTQASLLSDRTYGALKQTATIILPAVGALYFALAQLWGFGYANEVVGTVAALNVFVGLAVNLAQKWYNATGAKYDGSIDVQVDEDGVKRVKLNLDSDPEETLATKSELTFKINSP